MTQTKRRTEAMDFFDHFEELRQRLIWSLVGLMAATFIASLITPQALSYMIVPYCQGLSLPLSACRLNTISPTEAVGTYFRVALTLGAILSTPWMALQVWAFVSPGLMPAERRYVYFFVPTATGLFFIGAAFAWVLMIPAAIGFLSTFQQNVFSTDWRSSEYIPFLTSLLFWIGVSFEMPLVALVLARLGIVSARQLVAGWRYAIVLIAVAAAVITPTPDPFNMGLVMLPLLGLYVVSIGLAWLGGKRSADA